MNQIPNYSSHRHHRRKVELEQELCVERTLQGEMENPEAHWSSSSDRIETFSEKSSLFYSQPTLFLTYLGCPALPVSAVQCC
jgi:hypothetical protein